jgi:hypothetical protein
MKMRVSVGRIVHYILPDGPSKGEHRPAIVVYVWPESSYPGGDTVQLQVFTDGSNDGAIYESGIVWQTSVHEGTDPCTWHWPERIGD